MKIINSHAYAKIKSNPQKAQDIHKNNRHICGITIAIKSNKKYH